MKKTMKRFFVATLALLLLLPVLTMTGSAVEQNGSYAYVYDSYGEAQKSPSPYECAYRIDVSEYGVGALRSGAGLFVRNDDLYICDSGNNRILQLHFLSDGAEFIREITGTADGAQTLKNPTDVFVTEEGELVIADGGNNRILVLDQKLKLMTAITRPDDPTVDQTVPFKPNKLVMTAGHIYVQATSVNKGLMEFTMDGEFVGYIGASPVKFDWEDYLWKVFSTDAQREAMVAFVPTEYNNVALDPEGFLFVTNSVFNNSELRSGQAEPIRRLNLKGSNILIQNGYSNIMGDLIWGKDGPSKFVDVTALNDGTYYILDSTRSRVFAYDSQGNMLYAFGGIGTREGYFTTPVAMEHHNKNLVVLDSYNGLVTVMKHTAFGDLVSRAVDAYNIGDYDTSKGYWEEVLRHNGSYEMAYSGIGKVLLRNGDYEGALEYLKYAKNYYYYSKAWKLYRKDWIENNIVYIMTAIILAVAASLIWKLIVKIREKVENYELWHSQMDP